ncbi:VCBS repeat-containing protein [Pontibacter sp. E15-1]|uniref:VCBS repeat-containing protein n=1 Tax=Pontibacter sp. E15-1 TaxID=2919918 RepID=UPI001F4F8A2F|nr:VCBS repeat-containing protein [Pontibacter sp. E15-1]MCJ8164036.1 VCBS repeat-containing protein [Pontibacter sp. E15-1]
MRFSSIRHLLLVTLSVLAFSGCKQEETHLFERMDADDTGIDFSNRIFESDTMNILQTEYIYNGGGVGIGDFNNDGLPDVYFTGNMVPNRLYLNKGDFAFDDVTKQAKVSGEGKWCSGVALVDINNDGWLDIYVGATMKPDAPSRANLLYINNGVGKDGVPTFTESAAKYGIADDGHTTNAAFFDYDRDGDLDLYVLTNIINAGIPSNYHKKTKDGTAQNNDRLYRNEGNGTFTNVTREAGILLEGFGLGLAINDINMDGWPDIYITNDYLSNDLLYINNQDGTFTNRITDYVKHTSYSAMGNSVTDINNDGLVDILALDMLPEDNKHRKMMLMANNYATYLNNRTYNYEHQYVRNTLQLNQGMTPEGHPVFSEVSQLTGIYQTDWSWTPLVADFDNDGFRDVIITNGFPKDVTDQDFRTYRSGPAGLVGGNMFLLDSIPVFKTSNYAYRNKGNLTFSNETRNWGLEIPSFSNGAAYADLDNDGDLDFLVNNINDSAFVYRNNLYTQKGKKGQQHYLRLKFKGAGGNLAGLGASATIYYGKGKTQFHENSVYKGYLSSVENVAHFGLGGVGTVDSVKVVWPDGTYQLLRNVAADQVLTLSQKDAKGQAAPRNMAGSGQQAIFREAAQEYGVQYVSEEKDGIDFNWQRTLPHKLSQLGPGIAVGDVTGDGLDDFYVGGSAGKDGGLFVQLPDGTFTLTPGKLPSGKAGEDMGVLFFDADNDGDLDLYAASGSYEFEAGTPQLQDQLYLNDGKGNFTANPAALPTLTSSKSSVRAADYDKDGDLDLFVAGRVVPGSYPVAPESYILRNDGGRFTNVTASVSPELQHLGMITDALWSDFNGDGAVDLVVVGEWLPITFFQNINGTFKNVTAGTGIAAQTGWWNSLAAGDFDNDGDIDYVAGNLGLNTNYVASEKQPLRIFAKDFDNNGSMDPVLSCYLKAPDGTMKPYPMHTRDDLNAQMPRTRYQYPRYKKYALATIDEVIPEAEREGAIVMQATQFRSSYVENLGQGKFKLTALPKAAQLSPIFGIQPDDVDGDGNLDLLLVGNDYGTEVFTGRYDAFAGLYLKGNGKGGFLPASIASSGFFVHGDAKAISRLINAKGEKLTLVTQNSDSLRIFVPNAHPEAQTKVVALQPLDRLVTVTYKNGRKQVQEFYYGQTYLSQSSRKLHLTADVASITIQDFSGRTRTIAN